jgi:Ni/Co efflux regulator RcnB
MKQALRCAGIASLAAALLATTSLAMAQPYGHGPGDRDNRHPPRPVQARPDHRDYRHAPPPPPMRGPQFHGPRGAGPDHNWYRGGRIPPQYRGYQYVVNDWRGHHLSAPPRGYHWVQYGADYVLVAIATGVIMQLILSN